MHSGLLFDFSVVVALLLKRKCWSVNKSALAFCSFWTSFLVQKVNMNFFNIFLFEMKLELFEENAAKSNFSAWSTQKSRFSIGACIWKNDSWDHWKCIKIELERQFSICLTKFPNTLVSGSNLMNLFDQKCTKWSRFSSFLHCAQFNRIQISKLMEQQYSIKTYHFLLKRLKAIANTYTARTYWIIWRREEKNECCLFQQNTTITMMIEREQMM